MVGASRLGVCCSIRTPTMEVCIGKGEMKYRIDLVEKHCVVKTYEKHKKHMHEIKKNEMPRNCFLNGSQVEFGA